MPRLYNPNKIVTKWDKLGVNYWAIPKSGNTSMKIHLWELQYGRKFESNPMDIHYNKTFSKDVVKISVSEANQSNLYNFTVCRNPYSRFKSMYKDLCTTRLERGRLAGCSPDWSIEDFCDFVINHDDPVNTLDAHFLEQHRFIDESRCDVSIFKLESLYDDWKLPFPPMIRTSNRTEGIVELNDYTKESIYKFYREDFEVFGYKK